MAETETTWDGLQVAPERPYACCVVVWREGEHGRDFLVLHRLAAGGAGFEGDWAWTPPSGARQPGESPDAAAARELREETELMLPLASVPDAPSDSVALYATQTPPDIEVLLDHEHDEFLWLTLEEAVEKCLPGEVGACLANTDAWLDARTTAA
jgi:8-oxo-dGTP pyrophosphatase MutT (NUDIX family)